MQSFRTELENSIVEKDILDLAKKIAQFKAGEIHEEKFRSLRLARGVYGQRQQGVQMIRIKLPYGKMQFHQWKRMADISDEYSTGNLHLTTRQDIQIHFVSLDRAPELWAKLEQDDITLREACGNTVRNITASPTSGIDPNELFDVSPHADAAFRYFLRNPICQEMGRKIKISFSNTDEDTSLAYLHDMGFIPKIHQGVRGFRVVVGGGLGAQPMLAYLAHEFLPETEVIPFIESVLRVFDRHGERNSRHKARMKFLIQKIGFEPFMDLVKAETKALKNHFFEISDAKAWEVDVPNLISNVAVPSSTDYETWLATNTFEQKQVGYHAIYVRILNGNISSNTSRSLIEALTGYIGDDVRITINQGLMLKFVPTINLPYVYQVLETHHLAAPGANSIANITACPGTDTCNLAISDSTNITSKLEEVITQEFPSLIHDNQMKIKISGCMNACGQHSMASIGFHGSSLKAPDKRVLPALQVLLGGATLGNGLGKIADKVIKVPSKRGPEALRVLLNNFEENASEGEYFHDFYQRLGENHFYTLLKPLADLQNLANSDFIDWGASENFATEIGVGECAGVMIDLVATLLFDAEEKYGWAHSAYQENRFADAIYHAYSVYISAAKALLLDKSITVSNQIAVINKFDENFVQTGEFDFKGQSFQDVILQINEKTPDEHFAEAYLNQAFDFLQSATKYRQASISQ